MSLPVVITLEDFKQLGGLTGWSTERVRRFWDRNGLSLRDGKRDVYTTPDLIEERTPRIYRALCIRVTAAALGHVPTREDFEAVDD